jgi:hypothetical protein
MQKSYLSIYLDLKKNVFEIHEIVNLLSKKDCSLFLKFENWLSEIEKIMKKYNMENIIAFSGLRAKSIGIKNNKEFKRSKKLSSISDIIYESKDIFLGITEPLKDKKEEADTLIKQCLEIMSQYKIMPSLGNNFTMHINTIWDTIIKHDQLKSAGVKLLSMFSRTDILRLIANNIE